MRTFYYNIQKGDGFPFGDAGAVASQDVSLPIRVLFNENDSCGECVPLTSMEVGYTAADGSARTYRFEKDDNIILGHGDISERPL